MIIESYIAAENDKNNMQGILHTKASNEVNIKKLIYTKITTKRLSSFSVVILNGLLNFPDLGHTSNFSSYFILTACI